LNATITALCDPGGFNFALDANVTEVGLAYLPYIFKAGMKEWYRCVDDLSTLKMNGKPVSLEIKTRWAAAHHNQNDLRKNHWQAALQAYVTSVHMREKVNPAVLTIKIPEQSEVDSVDMALSTPVEEEEDAFRTGRNTLKLLFAVASKHKHDYAFCNGRLLLPWSKIEAELVFENDAHMHADVHLESTQNDLPPNVKVPLVRTPFIAGTDGNTKKFREWGLKFKHLAFYGRKIGLFYAALDSTTKYGIYFHPPKRRFAQFSQDNAKVLLICLLAAHFNLLADGETIPLPSMTAIDAANIDAVKASKNNDLEALRKKIVQAENDESAGIDPNKIIAGAAVGFFDRVKKVFTNKCRGFVP
jgi:hypothetical protein